MNESSIKAADGGWSGLYRVGGIAPLLTLIFYLSEAILIPWDSYPETAEGWFTLFGESRLQALFYLNALDIASIALLALMFLALFVALRRHGQSSMAISALLAFIGVTVFVATRSAMVSALQSLSEQYAAATTELEVSHVLVAGRAFDALGQATTQTIGFLFIAVAAVVASVVMLRSESFGRATAYVGILAGAITVVDHMCLVLLPSVASPLIVVGGVFWMGWWVTVGWRLLRLGGVGGKGGALGDA